MKTRFLFFAAAALVACAACTKTVEQPEPEGIRMTYRAYQEGAQDTKTTVQNGGTQVYWEAADEIRVFFKNFSGRFVSQNSEPAEVADFSGNLSILVGANEGAGSSNQTWALYPYRADATCDGENVTTTLPASQAGREGSFTRNTHISIARSGGYDLAFYNVTGGLRFSLTQEGISSVTFKGNNGEALAGRIKLSFESGVPVVKEVSEAESTVTLTPPAGGTFQTGQWYYIETVPAALTRGFTMVFTKGGETATLDSSGSVSILRGVYGSLANADEGLVFQEGGSGGEGGGGEGGGHSPSAAINFADPIAKYACVEKFDTNGDGEVSYEEAAAATSFAGLFTDWKTVKTFEEIKYFTSVTSTQNVFTGLTDLERITIPNNITKLGTFKNCTSLKTVVLPATLGSLPSDCFCGCTALTAVTLPTGIKKIPDYCFQNCSSLVSLALPSTVTALNDWAFSGCSSLGVLDLPSGLNSIGRYTFYNCKALASIDMPATLASIGSRAFYGCSSLSAVILPSSMTSIPDGLFYECSSLSSVIWPSAVTSVGQEAFYGCEFKAAGSKLEIPATVTTIGSGAFRGVRHLVMPSTKAISVAGDSFVVGYTRLYVPAGMIEMYKVRTNWSQFAYAIYPIEDYPATIWTGGGAVGEPVDLGLSVKWASWNVGASKPEDYGAYIAWGETEAKADYSWSTYKWCNGSSSSLTKYNSSDGKAVLELEDDAARVNWGGSWRMPTVAEWEELMNNCTWIWTSDYNGTGIKGQIVTSKKSGYEDRSIFLPAAGNRDVSGLLYVGSAGSYWSPSLRTDYPNRAWPVGFGSSDVFWIRGGEERYQGLSVRPVSE
ncbi:MAG: leucine-rich repeat protein [Bacteroidales bacterium]|nr:leucine-rich repeat protein [Bacteroidales bacterium]